MGSYGGALCPDPFRFDGNPSRLGHRRVRSVSGQGGHRQFRSTGGRSVPPHPTALPASPTEPSKGRAGPCLTCFPRVSRFPRVPRISQLASIRRLALKVDSPEPLAWSEEAGSLRIAVDTQLYSAEAVFRTCYLFTDRCYVFLAEGSDKRIIVRLSPKAGVQHVLADIAGDFGNELISQRIRLSLAEETKGIREAIVTQAFAEGGFDG